MGDILALVVRKMAHGLMRMLPSLGSADRAYLLDYCPVAFL